jgi:hypothetical protein
MTEKNLTTWVEEYQSGNCGERELKEAIARELYRNPYRFGLRDDSEVGEIFEHYFARIDAAINRYQNTGATFDAYFASHIRYFLLSLRRRHCREYDKKSVAHQSTQLDTENSDIVAPSTTKFFEAIINQGEADNYTIGPAFGTSGETARLRLIILCLKHAWVLDDDDIGIAAKVGGISESKLLEQVKSVRSVSGIYKQRFEHRRVVREAAWLRIQVLERRIAREYDVTKKSVLAERLKRERTLYTGKCGNIKHTRILIPNSLIASTLDIPKGTVDAALFFLRKRAESGLQAYVSRFDIRENERNKLRNKSPSKKVIGTVQSAHGNIRSH